MGGVAGQHMSDFKMGGYGIVDGGDILLQLVEEISRNRPVLERIGAVKLNLAEDVQPAAGGGAGQHGNAELGAKVHKRHDRVTDKEVDPGIDHQISAQYFKGHNQQFVDHCRRLEVFERRQLLQDIKGNPEHDADPQDLAAGLFGDVVQVSARVHEAADQGRNHVAGIAARFVNGVHSFFVAFPVGNTENYAGSELGNFNDRFGGKFRDLIDRVVRNQKIFNPTVRQRRFDRTEYVRQSFVEKIQPGI